MDVGRKMLCRQLLNTNDNGISYAAEMHTERWMGDGII